MGGVLEGLSSSTRRNCGDPHGVAVTTGFASNAMSIDRPPQHPLPGEPQPPVRSGDPQRDWYLEDRIDSSARPGALDDVRAGHHPSADSRQLQRMSGRAEGA